MGPNKAIDYLDANRRRYGVTAFFFEDTHRQDHHHLPLAQGVAGGDGAGV